MCNIITLQVSERASPFLLLVVWDAAHGMPIPAPQEQRSNRRVDAQKERKNGGGGSTDGNKTTQQEQDE